MPPRARTPELADTRQVCYSLVRLGQEIHLPRLTVHRGYLFRSENSFVSLDPVKRSCVFKRMNHNRYQHTEMAGNALYEANTMFTAEWRFDDKKVGKVNVYCAPPPTLCCTQAPTPRCSKPGRVLSS